MGPMGRAGLVVGMAVAAFAVGGCGSAPPGDGTGSTPVPVRGVTAPAHRFGAGTGVPGPDGGSGPVFPLTLRRTGGMAGFDDTVVLRANGQVLVTTRTVRGRVCRLTSAQQQELLSALGSLRLEPVPSTDPADPVDGTPSDPIEITVTDLRARPVDLSDPSLGELAGLVGSLVTDVTLSTPTATTCSTPSATPTPGPTATPSAAPADAGVVGAG